MSAPAMHGVIAEFVTAEALERAVKAALADGYLRLEAFSPFPLREIADALGVRTGAIPWIAAVAGLVGAVIQFGSQYWMNAVDYPLNIGGRPLNSWPAFVPATLIVAILWAGAATLLSMLFIAGLPKLRHPVFGVPGFERASEDRFFLLVRADDARFEPEGVSAFLHAQGAAAVREVAECD